MPEVTIKGTTGREFDPTAPAIFAVAVKASASESRQIRVFLEAAFLAYPIPRGKIVRTECYVACTAARFQLVTDAGRFNSWYRAQQVETRNRVVSKSDSKRVFGPEIKNGPKLGSITTNVGFEVETEFGSVEAAIADTAIGDRVVRWSLALHRGQKVVRDYLTGNLILWADCSWAPGDTPTVSSEAQAADRRFFGPDGRALGPITSLALYAKLVAAGVSLPEPGPVTHKVTIHEPTDL